MDKVDVVVLDRKERAAYGDNLLCAEGDGLKLSEPTTKLQRL